MKALSHADFKLEKDDIRAFGPYLKIQSELGRYHGLAPAKPGRRPGRGKEVLPAPPLALTHAAPPLDPDSGPNAAGSGAEPLEIARDAADSEAPQAVIIADFGA